MSAETQKTPVPPPMERAHEEYRNMWERGWARPGYTPEWRATGLPDDIAAAADRWFTPGAKLLDIGCGDGAISRILASRGFKVTGMDFSSSAIERARAQGDSNPPHGATDAATPRFVCADICQPQNLDPLGGPFDALLDRGCLHGLIKDFYPAYARSLAALAAPGARFLLLYALHHRATMDAGELSALKAETSERLRTTFAPDFDSLEIQDTEIEKQNFPVPALALRMVRGGGQV